MARPPDLVFELPREEDLANLPYVNASLAVASLTIAWHYVLRVEGHDKAAQFIELALESTARLRDSYRPHGT
jgi:hypothetical protein